MARRFAEEFFLCSSVALRGPLRRSVFRLCFLSKRSVILSQTPRRPATLYTAATVITVSAPSLCETACRRQRSPDDAFPPASVGIDPQPASGPYSRQERFP